MAWPTNAVATGDLVLSLQLNALPVMIANTTLSATTATIDFTSVPDHYGHILAVCYLRSTNATVETGAAVRFNNDSGSNYDVQALQGAAATASASEGFAGGSVTFASIPAASGGANLFGASTIILPNYANTSNNKVFTAKWAHKYGTTTADMSAGRAAGFWRSNSAINQITFLPVAGSFASGSRATLYGLP